MPPPSPTLHALGWDTPVLHRAVDWLVDAYGERLEAITVVVPAARAGRRLVELLAERLAGRAWTPPGVTTLAGLPERLMAGQGSGDAAPLDALTAWWLRAASLRDADPAVLSAVVPHAPDRDDWPGWLALAKQFERLRDELALGRLRMADVVRVTEERALDLGMSEPRWTALAALEALYDAARGGRDDWASAVASAAAGRSALGTAAKNPVVLVGLVDLPWVSRGLLERCENVTVLAPVPPEHVAGLDALGGLDVDYWETQHVAISRLVLADRPRDQAALAVSEVAKALDVLEAAGEPRVADAVTVGLGDERAAGPVRRALEQANAPAREAAGRPASRTGPATLLSVLARYARDRDADMLAALARHPDLRLKVNLSALDRNRREHVPATLRGALPEKATALRAARAAVDALLPEHPAALRSWPVWSEAILTLLQQVYGARSLNRRKDHGLIGALEALNTLLNEQVALTGPGAKGEVTFAQAVDLTLARLAHQRLPELGGTAAVELLGFLQLPLDDAPAVVVVDVNEGNVPDASGAADPFLPDGLRRTLGLPDTRFRYARDVLLMNVALRGRTCATVLACRHDAQGNPLMPSRLLLAADDNTVVSRVKAFYGPSQSAELAVSDASVESTKSQQVEQTPERVYSPGFWIPQPRAELLVAPLDKLPVTGFRDYLACPYRFYLKRVERLREQNDRSAEMDGGVFGDLAHAVLEDFGRSDEANSQDATRITRALNAGLDHHAAAQFGAVAAPAVRVQVERLRDRLAHFAQEQAKEAAEGWHILPDCVEKEIKAVFMVDGEPFTVTSKIDRVDEHPELGFRVVDYKTSDTGKKPEDTHRSGPKNEKRWTDLQLPLYRAMLALEGMGGAAVGYFNLAKKEDDSKVHMADWTEDDHADALGTRDWVIQEIRAGHFWPPKDPPGFDDGLARLCGDRAPQRAGLIEQSAEQSAKHSTAMPQGGDA